MKKVTQAVLNAELSIVICRLVVRWYVNSRHPAYVPLMILTFQLGGSNSAIECITEMVVNLLETWDFEMLGIWLHRRLKGL